MSLTTCCPACRTAFKVVPDQLKISGGWVRCGFCDEIFDAARHAAPADTAIGQPRTAPADTSAQMAPLRAPPRLSTDFSESLQRARDKAAQRQSQGTSDTKERSRASSARAAASSSARAAASPASPPRSASKTSTASRDKSTGRGERASKRSLPQEPPQASVPAPSAAQAPARSGTPPADTVSATRRAAAAASVSGAPASNAGQAVGGSAARSAARRAPDSSAPASSSPASSSPASSVPPPPPVLPTTAPPSVGPADSAASARRRRDAADEGVERVQQTRRRSSSRPPAPAVGQPLPKDKPRAASQDSPFASQEFATRLLASPPDAEAAARSSAADAAPTQVAAPAPISAFLIAEDDTMPPVSFVQPPRAPSVWHTPKARALLSLCAVLLLVLLAVQALVQDRDRLATVRPALKPLLEALCQPLACTVGAYRQLDAWVIDSSSFRRLDDSTFRLHFTLRSAAAWPLAAPALEVTLTDSQDRTVLRRVVTADDVHAAPVLAAGAEWSGALDLTVTGADLAARVTGYRIEAFYP